MSLELYLKETQFMAKRQSDILDDVGEKLTAGYQLSPLEESGVLHALQILIENAIGKSKHLLKHHGVPVPTSAYDAIAALVSVDEIPKEKLPQWNAIIGLRNPIVHEYMNLDIERVLDLVRAKQYSIVTDFLLAPLK